MHQKKNETNKQTTNESNDLKKKEMQRHTAQYDKSSFTILAQSSEKEMSSSTKMQSVYLNVNGQTWFIH